MAVRCWLSGSLASAAQIANPLTHNTGSASVAATGTVQRRSVVAPQITSTAAAGSRSHSGIGIWNCATDPPSGVDPRNDEPVDPQLAVDDERDGNDGPGHPERDPQRPPLSPDGEPEQADPRRHLREQDEPPRPRIAEPEGDRGRDPQVDVAVVELERDRRERQQPDDPDAAPAEPDDVADQQGEPQPQERRPLERAERLEQPRDRWRVVERSESTDADLVWVRRRSRSSRRRHRTRPSLRRAPR